MMSRHHFRKQIQVALGLFICNPVWKSAPSDAFVGAPSARKLQSAAQAQLIFALQEFIRFNIVYRLSEQNDFDVARGWQCVALSLNSRITGITHGLAQHLFEAKPHARRLDSKSSGLIENPAGAVRNLLPLVVQSLFELGTERVFHVRLLHLV